MNIGLPGIFAIVYVLVVLLIAWIASRNIKTSTDYLVAGRNKPFWLTSTSLLATWICSGTIMGGAGIAYEFGLFETIYDPFAAAISLILAGGLGYIAVLRKMKLNSIGSFYHIRFGATASKLSALSMVPTYALWVGVQMMAFAYITSMLFGASFTTMLLVGAIILIGYTYLGGLLAVAWTDVLQIVIVIAGIIILYPIALNAAGGMSDVREVVPPEYFSMSPHDFTLVGILTYAAMWLGTALGTIPAPDMHQRSFMARTPQIAVWSAITAGVAMIIIGYLAVNLGLFGIVFAQEGVISAELAAQDNELVIIMIAEAFLHPVVFAIFVGAMLAAIMSSGDSGIFATAAILSNDMAKPYLQSKGKTVTDNDLIKLTRLFVIVIGVISLLLAFASDSLYYMLVLAFTLIFGILFFPLTLGIWWKKANEYGAVAAMIVGFVIPLLMAVFQRVIIPDPYWVIALLVPAISGTVMVVVSLVTQASCPPKALRTAEGEVLKWPELDELQGEGKPNDKQGYRA